MTPLQFESLYQDEWTELEALLDRVLGRTGGKSAVLAESGARVVVTLLHQMRRSNAKRGIATLCISGGMGMAMLIERD